MDRVRLEKNLLFLVVLIYYLGGYYVLSEIAAKRTRVFHLSLPFEDQLPFYPALVFAYMLIFAIIAFVFLVVDDFLFFRKIARAFLICVTIHFIFFALFPVEYTLRPKVDPGQGWAYGLVAFYYWVDSPYNCCPSLHVSNAFLVSFILERYRPGWGWFFFPASVLIAISVVLVKQHYVVDVVLGFFVAWMVFRRVFGPTPARVWHPVRAPY